MVTGKQKRMRLAKAERLRAGGIPRALELCSGCGGLSLGLATAGFELTAHVEFDPVAAASYALNFASGGSKTDAWTKPRDMVRCSADTLVAELGLGSETSAAFDVLAAGLPCQAFARIGRSKLREMAGGKNDAFRRDPRATLYRRFLHYVEDTQPLAIVIENVPDILNFGGHNIPEEISATLEELGYRSAYTILNAAYYGVPQVRERLFLIAYADDLNIEPLFPSPSCYLELPRGYEGSRRVALKHVPGDSPHFRKINDPAATLPAATGVRDALSDLPRITEHRTEPTVIRKRQLGDVLPYRDCGPLPAFAHRMRMWDGFEGGEGTDGHLVRLTPRDFPIFGRLPHGADYPKARALAETMLEEALKEAGIRNPDRRSAEYRKLRAAIVPPYDPAKFPNKWWKLDPLKPSRTLTAHMGKDTYSHIHYDGRQCRTVSVREAARLQSFPDGFRFAGAMNAAFRQIGNAVPPLLALAIATTIRGQLTQRQPMTANLEQAA